MPDREATLGSLDMEVEAIEGELEDGVVQAEKVKVSIDTPVEVELTGSVEFQSDHLEDALKEAMLPFDCYWPDTIDNENWEEPVYADTGTKKRAVLQHIITNPLCTTGDILEVASDALDVRNIVYELKKDNLVRAVGRNGSSHVLVPTHLGYKEHYVVYGDQVKQEAFEDEDKSETTNTEQFFQSSDETTVADES